MGDGPLVPSRGGEPTRAQWGLARKATELPGRAQLTATPRSLAAPRQRYSPTVQEKRDSPAGLEQPGAFAQEATTPRPMSQPTPVTRSCSVPATVVSPQLRAEAPGGAFGVVARAVGSPPPDSVESPPEEPQPPIAAAQRAAMRTSRVGPSMPQIYRGAVEVRFA